MYEDFFGFSRRPFSLTPDPEFLYWTDQHRQAFDLVCMSLLRRAPIALITGEVGAGKTTLLQALIHEISTDFEVGLLSNVVGDSGDLLRWMLTAFGEDSAPATRADTLRQVEAMLVRFWEAGRRTVLVIDEAQNVSDHGIETLRLLTNMDVGKTAPLSLIVAGQPELRARVAAPAFAAFRQRLGASFHLGPMTLEETEGYVRRRIEIAGGEAGLIDSGAIAAIYRRAKGVPRLTNLLADLCFVAAYGDDCASVDEGLAETALTESLAIGGLGGLAAETAGSAVEVPVRRTAASGSARPAHGPRLADGPARTQVDGAMELRRPAPPVLRVVTADPKSPPPEEPPLLLTGPMPPEERSAAFASTDRKLAVHEPPRPGGGRVWHRMLGSAAGLAVAASLAGVALILPATGTDGGQVMVTDAAMPVVELPLGAETGGEVATIARDTPDTLALGLVEARLAPPDLAGAERLFERALDEAVVNPSAAVIDYSRAAARGHGRAAYYLAQMYETGDGVPFAPDTAWNWYAAAVDHVPGAEERLAEVAAFATTDASAARPMFSAMDNGVAELVWQGRGSYVVELASRPDAATGLVHPTALTAVRLEVPQDVAWWRVRAVGAEPSDWVRLGTSKTD